MKTNWKILIEIAFGIGLFIGIAIIYNIYLFEEEYYNLFHVPAEFFSIFISWSIFVIAWNSRRFAENRFYLFIGLGFLHVGILDFIHTMVYRGLFLDIANYSTQFWIAARFLQAFIFLFAILFYGRKWRISIGFLNFSVATIILIWTIFGGIFPTCYVDLPISHPNHPGYQTSFKLINEYIIIIILIITVILFIRKRRNFEKSMIYLLISSLIFAIFSEFAFTFYVEVFGVSNLIGHLFKIASVYCIYRSLIEANLTKPYETLFRDLKTSETNLHQEKEMLLQLNQQINTILRTVPDAILFLDEEGRMFLFNDTVSQLYKENYDEELYVGFDFFDSPENRMIKCIKLCYEGDFQQDNIIEFENGKSYQITSATIRGTAEKLIGLLIVFHDVTEFIELEKMRKQIISTVSHELRTPLTVIDMSIKNLEKYRGRMTEEQKDSLIKRMAKSSIVLAQMIDDLLVSSRIEEGRLTLKWVEYSLHEVINEVLIQMDPKISDKNIIIDLEEDPKIVLYGDPERIGQILRILIDNAVKYSPEGSHTKIRTVDHYQGTFNPQSKEGGLIQVIDEGRGIPKKYIHKIFSRFYRTEDVSDLPGTGLGLAIAKDLVQLHSGEIFVESEYGKGTTFSVFLPYIQKQET